MLESVQSALEKVFLVASGQRQTNSSANLGPTSGVFLRLQQTAADYSSACSACREGICAVQCYCSLSQYSRELPFPTETRIVKNHLSDGAADWAYTQKFPHLYRWAHAHPNFPRSRVTGDIKSGRNLESESVGTFIWATLRFDSMSLVNTFIF